MTAPKDQAPSWLSNLIPHRKPPSLQQRANALIAAVDAGGLPLHPGIVNDIARQLGLEVSANAPMEVTIARIRSKLAA
jgi:hypothetical protein